MLLSSGVLGIIIIMNYGREPYSLFSIAVRDGCQSSHVGVFYYSDL